MRFAELSDPNGTKTSSGRHSPRRLRGAKELVPHFYEEIIEDAAW
jgi:hypothetical protein